jgi:HD-GYP domain-containing protein (c-di-GMP phosphodiesterase class II)
MVNDRPYHKAMPEKDAIKELRRCAGTQFDPHVIEKFITLLEREELPEEEREEIENARNDIQDGAAGAS